jgi:hypothetical protein
MRIHTNVLTPLDVFEAARISRTQVVWTVQGSRIRTRSIDVSLTGESRRRPNSGKRGAGWSSEYAATWDQWGVFFAVLFDRDPAAVCGAGLKSATYRSRDDFHWQTCDRFRSIGIVSADTPGAFAVNGDDWDGTDPGMRVYRREQGYWPTDYHGDHTFRFGGVPYQQECTKCSAVKRWRLYVPEFDCETTDYALSDCKHWGKPGTECSGPRVGLTPDGVILCEGHYNRQPVLVGV